MRLTAQQKIEIAEAIERIAFLPAQPEPKREEKAQAVCQNCGEVATYPHGFVHDGEDHYLCQPAPSPAPVAGELAEAAERAISRLLKPGSPLEQNLAATYLETWARSQATAQTVAVGMTPELDRVLDFAFACGDEDGQIRLDVAAVRAQAVSAKPKAVPVEAIPVGIWQLEDLLKYADLAEVALRTGFHPPEFLFTPADRSLRQSIDAVKEQRDRWLAAVEGGGS